MLGIVCFILNIFIPGSGSVLAGLVGSHMTTVVVGVPTNTSNPKS